MFFAALCCAFGYADDGDGNFWCHLDYFCGINFPLGRQLYEYPRKFRGQNISSFVLSDLMYSAALYSGKSITKI
jgi:hypothetical protein